MLSFCLQQIRKRDNPVQAWREVQQEENKKDHEEEDRAQERDGQERRRGGKRGEARSLPIALLKKTAEKIKSLAKEKGRW
jgi:hypothetical protein